LRQARDLLAATPGLAELAASPVYETEPVDVPPAWRDHAFLNAVVIARCTLTLDSLAARVAAIETALGRLRPDETHAPRTIDVDVIYAGATVSDAPALRLPHPRWAGRRFVVQPLADVRPALVLPGAPGSVRAVLLALSPVPRVVRYPHEW
jgi:2-amino-4-hydroxy-6-hydroxymethyldihydropteridine diphosphokinase